ncbi:MAG: branched-chain amino acid ABC transporter permease [Candidatus Atribacteria bacterium]|nr:branched-chain amino acid ABC transporter permease [Candidatus Atribacteria bacterium]
MIIFQVLLSGIFAGLVYGLISIGLSLIWGIMDMVNFAHADFMMLSMYFTFLAFTKLGLDPLFSLPAIAVLMFFIGSIVVYRSVIWRMVGSEILYQILCTFGIVVFLQSLAQFLWSANYHLIRNSIASGSFAFGGLYLQKGQGIAGIASLIIAGFIWWFINKTKIGWALQATAQNREAAPLIGINIDRMFALSWGIGLSSVGIAGVLLANFYYIYPQVGATFQLLALVSVALGGFGSIPGAILAGLIVGLTEALSGYFIDPAYKYVVVFSLYIIILLLRPQGLFGTHH